jgi:hypothetical protein
MTVPTAATYSAAAKIAAHTALLTLIDSGASTSKIRLRDALDVLVAEYVLDSPGGTVNGTTGQLTLDIVDTSIAAAATLVIAYAQILDGDSVVHLSLPAVEGETAVTGHVVVNQLSVAIGAEVNLLSAVIG